MSSVRSWLPTESIVDSTCESGRRSSSSTASPAMTPSDSAGIESMAFALVMVVMAPAPFLTGSATTLSPRRPATMRLNSCMPDLEGMLFPHTALILGLSCSTSPCMRMRSGPINCSNDMRAETG